MLNSKTETPATVANNWVGASFELPIPRAIAKPINPKTLSPQQHEKQIEKTKVGAHTGNVGERDKVPRCGDGAAQWQLGRHLAIEQLLHSLQNFPSDARKALQQRVRAYQHSSPSCRHGKRVAGVHHARIQKPENNEH